MNIKVQVSSFLKVEAMANEVRGGDPRMSFILFYDQAIALISHFGKICYVGKI